MYEQHWQLDRKPFENTSDTAFYYPSEVHQGALLKLRYAVESRRGAALLVGQPGLGKTLLVESLIQQLGEDFQPRVRVVFPRMPVDQLITYIVDELTGERHQTQTSVLDAIQRLERVLAGNLESGRHAVVVVDEAHVLENAEALETLRLLTNFELETKTALTLLLVGQSSLLPVLERTPQLDERLAVKCLLRPFSLEESISYVAHRLRVAGAQNSIFDDESLEAVHHHSRGIARRINRLCDLALLIGFAEERNHIGPTQIEAISGELVAVSAE